MKGVYKMKKFISFILSLSTLLAFTSCKREPCDKYKCFSGTIQCDKCMGKGLEICTSCDGIGNALTVVEMADIWIMILAQIVTDLVFS